MTRFKTQKASLVFMFIMSFLISSSLVYGGSVEQVRDQKTPDATGAVALLGVFGGGSGMTNQGIYAVVNGDIGTTAASPLVTGFHDKGAVYTERTSNSGTVNGTIHKVHPLCQDSCSL